MNVGVTLRPPAPAVIHHSRLTPDSTCEANPIFAQNLTLLMTCHLELSANLPQASSKIAPSSPPFSFSAPLKGVEAQQRPPLPQAVRGAANGIKFRNRSRKNLSLTPSSLSVGEAFTGMHPLYQDVCSVLSQADRRKGTLKRLCLAGGIRNKRATLALASETSRWD